MPLATEEITVKVAVEGFSEFTRTFKKMDGQLDDTTKATADATKKTAGFGDQLGKMYTGLQQAAIGYGVLKVASEAIQWAREGAAIEATSERFAAFVGNSREAEVWLRQLREATNYTISDFDAMAGVTRLLSMGLADTSAQAQELVRIALALGDQTQSASDRINDFSLLLSNQSVARLDNFGISSGKVRERIKELQAATEGLTREQAFMQAVLEQGRVALDTVGDSADSNIGSWQRLDAAFRNSTNELKRLVAQGLSPAAEGLAALLSFNTRVTDMQADFTASALESSKAWEEYAAQMLEAGHLGGQNAEIQRRLRTAMTEAGWSTEQQVRAMSSWNNQAAAAIELGIGFADALSRTDYNAIQAGLEAVSSGYSDVGASAPVAAEAVEAYAEATVVSKEAVEALNVAFQGRLGKAFDDHAEKTVELTARSEELRAKIAELEERQWLSQKQREELEETRAQLAENDAAIAKNAAAHEEAVGRIIFSMAQQVAARDGFTQDELEYLAEIGQAYGVLDEESASALKNIERNMGLVKDGTLSAKEAADLLKGSIDGLQSKEISVKVTWDVQQPPEVVHRAVGYTPTVPRPKFQSGGTTMGRSMLVGESGPELLTGIPGGARVLSNPTTSRMLGGGNTTVNNYNLTTNSLTRPGGLALEFSAMEMGSR